MSAIQNVTVQAMGEFYTAISVSRENVMEKCPVISLNARMRQKSDVAQSSSLSAILADGIADLVQSQTHGRIYAFKKPEMPEVHIAAAPNEEQ
ncbi:hypothetical protein [Noviherbaspirillum saxi]|uniref:Uncharacterized protein n=1 Tax=Noviherbaspirillum saxi TaxID=2320863 RepID=A0A3A3FLL4_9BURK|nr:hypothetical protein [Noviherbaspirillum saxi]RJF95365.1 hypothetical protein D3871_18225 [Noviherbaspirillum saxi]